MPLRPFRSGTIAASPCKPSVNLDHLRFFRHFLIEAYPPHPYSLSAVWQDVAALSHNYDFLAHALLALAAQHLTLFTQSDYSVQALDLRVSALQGLNAAFSRPCLTAAEGDARCAAAIALTWQSSYMSAPGSLREFLVTMRGWMVVATTMTPEPEKSLFRDFTREAFVGSMKRHVTGDPTSPIGGDQTPDRDCSMDGFLASLQVLRPLCGRRTEKRYLSVLEKLGRLARTSPLDALLQMAPCWALTNKMTEDEFTDFADPTNHTAQVLLAHFLMLDRALEMHFLEATGSSQFTFCKQVSKAWIVNMASGLPVGYEKYMMWPLGLARGEV
ncbi:Mss4-like protein [Purpureocillium lavendulum]|uniref:Mss4-like protein n=1 Tax=Purpureocillium lavendulum TaxID=1247861 RepID=A0AB34G2K9_9HYPO|nr:Mss4-like protein [Purpureocillium lavendulum]